MYYVRHQSRLDPSSEHTPEQTKFDIRCLNRGSEKWFRSSLGEQSGNKKSLDNKKSIIHQSKEFFKVYFSLNTACIETTLLPITYLNRELHHPERQEEPLKPTNHPNVFSPAYLSLVQRKQRKVERRTYVMYKNPSSSLCSS
jgi:hypothetical protein